MPLPSISRELAAAVRRGAVAHAADMAMRAPKSTASPAPRPVDCGHLLELLDDDTQARGIHDKTRIALRSIVRHVVYLEARVDALERKRKRRRP
jgi:hypothetical protein